MSNVISGGTYKVLADYYSTARDADTTKVTNLYDAVYYIVQLDETYPEVDLLNSFWQTYLGIQNSATPSAPYLTAVRALNSHVLVRGTEDTLDLWLAANGLTGQLTATWKTLSSDAGYPITV